MMNNLKIGDIVRTTDNKTGVVHKAENEDNWYRVAFKGTNILVGYTKEELKKIGHIRKDSRLLEE